MHLFSTSKIRDIEFRNRIVVSPMCQYSCTDGFANDWHYVHLGSRAVGGAALVIAEATAVEGAGRISPEDLGLWKDEHIESLARTVSFIKSQGAVAGVQLGHAGRKASTAAPWNGGKGLDVNDGGWRPIFAPSAIAFDDGFPTPVALDGAAIQRLLRSFADAARRALEAGFEVIEIHGAHGYLIDEFLSPLTNKREDEYGGSFENRIRFACEVTSAIRNVWPERLPLFMRLSVTDWVQGGWTLEDSISLARRLKTLGVDLIDCSSGGLVPRVRIPVGPGYQVAFAEQVRREANILTGAVGMITRAEQADQIIRTEQADFVLLARQLLRDPYWPLHAALTLGHEGSWPKQYLRAKD